MHETELVMKISDIGKKTSMPQAAHPVQGKQADAQEDKPFARQMNSTGQVQLQEYIEDMQHKIMLQGEVIKTKADMSELQQYRKLITELLNETVSNAYSFVSTNSFTTRGQHKMFVVIRKVNQKLEELTQEILNEQTDNLRLLDMVDDIRGMLVDLFM